MLHLETIISRPTSDGHTWTLSSRLGQMLHEIEERFGPRDRDFTILGCEFTTKDSPGIWYPGNRKHVIIQLNMNALNEPLRAYYQLAHEAIHLLSPSGKKGTNNLDEGLATYYSQEFMIREFQSSWSAGLPCYEEASGAVKRLLQLNPYAIREIRIEQPSIQKITSTQIKKACPEISIEDAEFLSKPFVRSVEVKDLSKP
jgi:hypothetical protein